MGNMKFSVRYPLIRILLGLFVGLSLVAGSLIPQAPARLHLEREEALAADASVASCDEASFDAALATVQGSGGGTISFSCTGTIGFTSEKVITSAVTIIGNGNVSFDGGDSTRLFDVYTGASLELVQLMLQNGNSDFNGGAINSDGTLTITGSAFSGNRSYFNGGTIYNTPGGRLAITSSSFSGGSAVNGGAIDNRGTLEITGSTFSDNSASDYGGAIYNADDATLTITDSTFSDHLAGAGGAIYNADATLTITDSTFSDNLAGAGGAIGNNETATITSSTFGGNNAQHGGAIYNSGGGGPLAIISSTFGGNNAEVGGAIFNFDGTLTIGASIVAGNTATTNGPNCHNDATLTSLGSNLSDDDSCPFIAGGDIQDSNAVNLGPLVHNGGPTQTMLPASDSDAIDAADCGLSTAEDQRGVSCPQGAGCDIGAVERGRTATYPLCASYYTGVVTSPLTGSCGAGRIELVVPGNLSFCIDLYTGQLLYTFGRPCNPPRQVHTMPEDGDLLTCVSIFSGSNRWVFNHSQCTAYELPNTIPATP